jgi:hypothetical protein
VDTIDSFFVPRTSIQCNDTVERTRRVCEKILVLSSASVAF